jgi:amidohydrolase
MGRRVGMGGEDFSFYAQRVPSTFCYIGVRPPGCENYPPVHTPTFDFTDQAIRTGVALHAGWTLRASADGLPA